MEEKFITIGDETYSILEKQRSNMHRVQGAINNFYKNLYTGVGSLLLGSPQTLGQSLSNMRGVYDELLPVAEGIRDKLYSGIVSLNNGR
jgi:hypothetical protein